MTFSPCLYMQKHDGSRNSDYTIKEPLALKYLDVTNIFVCIDDYCYSVLGWRYTWYYFLKHFPQYHHHSERYSPQLKEHCLPVSSLLSSFCSSLLKFSDGSFSVPGKAFSDSLSSLSTNNNKINWKETCSVYACIIISKISYMLEIWNFLFTSTAWSIVIFSCILIWQCSFVKEFVLLLFLTHLVHFR